MSFRLVPKSVTSNDLERRSGVILRYFSEFGSFRSALGKSSRLLSHLLMSSCLKYSRRVYTLCNKISLVLNISEHTVAEDAMSHHSLLIQCAT